MSETRSDSPDISIVPSRNPNAFSILRMSLSLQLFNVNMIFFMLASNFYLLILIFDFDVFDCVSVCVVSEF